MDLRRLLSLLAALLWGGDVLSDAQGFASLFGGKPVCAAKETKGVRLAAPFPLLPELNRPVAMLMAPGDDSNWYLVQQPGRVVRFDNSSQASRVTAFVDISERVAGGGVGGDERGLLGMAFHPGYSRNGYLYLSYTGRHKQKGLVSRISRFHLKSGAGVVDPASERILLSVAQPYSNHNGGQIAFGPEGYLYFGLGDGGAGGDPHGHGQNTRTLLGAMLRIDVGDGGSGQYTIPADNPFAAGDGRGEIFAWGLRNPWRWSFDRKSGDLWVGDVGQNRYEEINQLVKGGNYGWNRMEGDHCFEPASDCRTKDLKMPLEAYGRNEGIAVTGGYVYRGRRITALWGKYLYADYGSGRIWQLSASDEAGYVNSELFKTDLNISSFAEAHDGELFVLGLGGEICKIVNALAK